ncbi:hypothetical protein [Streptomyces sp. NPDC056628]|uniref:hypothetical protein n=1 Tax=Streptomyces sp. NPDC056628 TaxID=3345882 RepID=UPI0036CDB957
MGQEVLVTFTSNPDVNAVSSYILVDDWDDNRLHPVACPYNPGTFRTPGRAWERIRRLGVVYAFVSSGPPISGLSDTGAFLVHNEYWMTGKRSDHLVRHSPPISNPGMARIWGVSRSGGSRLLEDLRLDGSASKDPDGGQLTYSWALESFPPGAAKLPWQKLIGATPVALPAGTEVPDAALGPYVFRLTVTDAFGSASAAVTHSIVRVNSGPRADAGPPEQTFRLLNGMRPKRDIIVDASGSSDPDGDPLTYTWQTVRLDRPGPFLLPSPRTQPTPDLLLAPAGQKLPFDVAKRFRMDVEVKDTHGATAADSTVVNLEMVRPTITLGAGVPPAIAFDDLVANGLRLPVTMSRPEDPDLVVPDSWELFIHDRNSEADPVLLRSVDDAELAGGVLWNGATGPGVPARPGQFLVQLRGYTEGSWFVSSEPYYVDVVKVEVTVEGKTQASAVIYQDPPKGKPPVLGNVPRPGPIHGGSYGGGGLGPGISPGHMGPIGGPVGGQIGSGLVKEAGRKAFAIQDDHDRPKMPAFTVAVSVLGPRESAIRKLAVDARVQLSWDLNGQPQAGQIPESGWHTLAPGESQWAVTSDVCVGGEVTAQARVTYMGVTVQGQSTGAPPILGRNPSGNAIRAAVGGPGYAEVAYAASRFRQFGTDGPSIGEVVLSIPYNKDGGAGLTGLTTPTAEQQWNWRANADEFRRRARIAQAAALSDEAAVMAAHNTALPLSADELNLEVWTRLKEPAARYHAFEPASQYWSRIQGQDAAASARERADRLAFLSAAVKAGMPPQDWTDIPTSGPGAKLSESPEGVIRSLLSSGGSLDAAVAAANTALQQMPWWELHTTLDALAGPGTGPAVAGILDLLASGTPNPSLYPRAVAAVEAARLRRGTRIITEADLPRLQRYLEALHRLPPTEQQLALQSIGLSALTAEGIVAAINAEEASATGGSAVVSIRFGSTLPPPGKWDPPGKMPVPYYIGWVVHLAIGEYYRAVHQPHGYVATNTDTLSKIMTEIVKIYKDADIGAVLDATAAILKPDILEVSPAHFPEIHAYEIKPEGSEVAASTQVMKYLASLISANIPAAEGPKGLVGTYGWVPAPGGWAGFNSPMDGVIAYKYFRRPEQDVRKQNKAEGREENKGLEWKKITEVAAWNPALVYELFMLLTGLIALGFIIALASAPEWAPI